MIEWIKQNAMPLLSFLWIFFLLYRSWRQEVRQKALEGNHLTSIDKDIKELKSKVDGIEKQILDLWRAIERIKGRFNGK